jgi:RNA polymerase sigma factor (TIGR02999 family)
MTTENPDDFFAQMYADLRVAASRVRWRFQDLPLQTTDVLHETYLRIAARSRHTVTDRSHYMAIAVQGMRRYLLDEARRFRRRARSESARSIDAIDDRRDSGQDLAGLLELLDALDQLAHESPAVAEVMELHIFGVRQDDIGAIVNCVPRTVRKRLSLGRARLRQLLADDPRAPEGLTGAPWMTATDDDDPVPDDPPRR